MAGIDCRCDRRGSGERQLFCCAPVIRYGRSKPSQRCSQFSRLAGVAVDMFALGRGANYGWMGCGVSIDAYVHSTEGTHFL